MMTELQRIIRDPLSSPIADLAEVRGVAVRSPLHGLARRTLQPIDILAQSVSAVGPSGVAVTIPPMLAAIAGGSALYALVAAGLMTYLVASTLNQFSTRISASGSLYTFAAKSIGVGGAFFTACGLALGYGIVILFSLLGCTVVVTGRISGIGPATLSAMPLIAAAVFILLLVMLGALAVRRVRLSTRIALVAEIVSISVILGLSVWLIVAMGVPSLADVATVPGPQDAVPFAMATAIAMTAFVGFESAAALGPESKRPRATVPRAIRWTVLIAGLGFLVTTYAELAGFRFAGLGTSIGAHPADDLAGALGMPGAGAVLDATIVVSMFACALAHTTALTRLIFTMAREGVLPQALGRAHPVFQTPSRAVLVALPVLGVVPLIAILSGIDIWWLAQEILSGAIVGFLLAYTLVCIGAPIFLRRIGESTAAVTGRAIAASVLLAGILSLYIGSQVANGDAVLIAASVGLVAASSCLWVRARRRRMTVGLYDEVISADLLTPSGNDVGRPTRPS